MSDVSISIAGRSYTVACGEGEEGHIRQLGQMIDRKLSEIPNLSSQSEARALLFASLLLADDLHEQRSKAAPDTAANDDAIAGTLENLAQKLEGIASRLESGQQAS